MKKKSALSTGEFARLCKTTKETLFHYDREKLLAPKHVSENGYRYYGAEQFFDFDMITVLKETGSSLKEIKTLLAKVDAHGLISLLEEKCVVIKRDMDRLAQREMMLHDMISCTHEALNSAYDKFVLETHEEEGLEILPTEPATLEPSADFAARFAEYIAFYEKEDRLPSYPFGVILPQEDVSKGQYLEKYIFSRATPFTPASQLHIKPAGKYAVLAHQGTVETHLRAFGRMLKRIKTAGLRVAGEAYVYDLMSHALLGSGPVHASKYCLRVE